MEKILAESLGLTPALLMQDEEGYDKLAIHTASKLSSLTPQQLMSKELLDVSVCAEPLYTI
jgi:hypothetical protein